MADGVDAGMMRGDSDAEGRWLTGSMPQPERDTASRAARTARAARALPPIGRPETTPAASGLRSVRFGLPLPAPSSLASSLRWLVRSRRYALYAPCTIAAQPDTPLG